jgi:hypothetical protein
MILNQSYGYEIYDNGKLTDKSESLDAGTYEVQIPLDGDGEHDVLIYIVDSDGNKRSTSGSFNRDTVPPYVALDKEYDGMSVGESEYTISGSIKDYDKLIINEDEVKPSSDGHFEYTCKLHEGDNKISITATDAAENITSGEVVLTYNKKESSNNHVSTMIAVVVLLVLIKLLFSRKKKNRKNPRSKKQKRNSKEPPMRPDTEKSGEDADDEEEDEEEEEDVIL